MSPTSFPLSKSASTPPPSPPADRVAHLFRTSLRAGLVHPLHHLLQRYRRGASA